MTQKYLSPGGRSPEARKASLADEQCCLPKTPAAKSPLLKSPNATVAAVIALLAERWPCTFSIQEKRRRPLKIGIHVEILSALDGAVTRAELSRALGCYVANGAYLSRLREGAARIGLDGAAAGEVTKAEEDRSKMQRWLAMLERERGG
jgi:sRNA-binding protein